MNRQFGFLVPNQEKAYAKLMDQFMKYSIKLLQIMLMRFVVLSKIAQGYVDRAYHRSSRIVRSGVDVEVFHNASGKEIREKYGLGNDFVLLQVGNFQQSKGQADSIKALYQLSKNYDRIKLILDGGGPKEQLVKLSEKLGLKDKVLFLHSNDDEELAQVYAACDVFLFPQQITWGLAVIEAMAASKPVIVSSKCGASEIIQPYDNGLVFDQSKPEEIAEKVKLITGQCRFAQKTWRTRL